MITLGINATFHDSAAALVLDGTVIAAAEEERFTRIKHGKRPVPFTAWELPFHAIDYCLAEAGATLREIDHVAYSFEPQTFAGDRLALTGPAAAASVTLPLRPSTASKCGGESDWESAWDPLFVTHVVNAPGHLADGAPHHLRQRLSGIGRGGVDAPYRWHFVNHHTCHQASAFLAAPFTRCAVMTLDGRGERASTTYGRHRDSRYEALGEVHVPHSLGLLYERVTSHLGFLHSSDEYKVMALAALGQPRFHEALKAQLTLGDGGRYEIAAFDPTALFGPARRPGEVLTQQHFDITASLQQLLEETVLQLASWLREASGERQLAMAGGVALNCVMNSVLRDSGIFDAVWIQPAAGDSGTALGAALWVDARERRQVSAPSPSASAVNEIASRNASDAQASTPAVFTLAPRRWQMNHAYLGPGFSDDEIERQLQWAKLGYTRVDDIADAAAEMLAQGRIVGWFQGRMEYGPRALGARSILASPRDPQMQARLNELKDREDFRPVAPAVPVERLADWFSPADANGGVSPFMLFVYDVAGAQADRIPSACHTDHTARVQTVDAATHPRFHALLEAFGARTGVPVLINTSFNVRGEPIVCTPRAAIEAFFSTPLDVLAIGSFLVVKPNATVGGW